jgi:hypothetical protein
MLYLFRFSNQIGNTPVLPLFELKPQKELWNRGSTRVLLSTCVNKQKNLLNMCQHRIMTLDLIKDKKMSKFVKYVHS